MAEKKKKNIGGIIFWSVLILVAAGAYFVFPFKRPPSHLNVIPANADQVTIVNFYKVFHQYMTLLENDPTAFGDETWDDEDKDVSPPRIGINPVQPMALYTATYNNKSYNLGVVELLAATDLAEFLNNGEKPTSATEYKNVAYWNLEEQKTALIAKKELGLVLLPNKIGYTNKEIENLVDEIESYQGELWIDNHVSDGEVENNFFNQWSKENSKNINIPYPIKFSEVKRISNILDSGIVVQTHYTHDAPVLKENANDEELVEDASFEFSAVFQESYFQEWLLENVPIDFHQYQIYANGAVNVEVHAFEPYSIYSVFRDSTDSTKWKQQNVIDFKIPLGLSADAMKVSLSDFISFPVFSLAIGLNDASGLINKLNTDSIWSKKDGVFKFTINNVMIDQPGFLSSSKKPLSIYMKIENDVAIISPFIEYTEMKPSFNKYQWYLDFDHLVNHYDGRSFYDKVGITYVPELNLDVVKSNLVISESNTTQVNTLISTKDKSKSQLIQIPKSFLQFF